jgi:hypothetical protein
MIGPLDLSLLQELDLGQSLMLPGTAIIIITIIILLLLLLFDGTGV